MKKIFFFLCIAVLLFSGCSLKEHIGDEETIISEKEITENTKTEEWIETVVDEVTTRNDVEVLERESEANTNEANTDEESLSDDMNYDYEEAYISVIEETYNKRSNDSNHFSYDLVWINDDKVPELIIWSGALTIYTYVQGQVYSVGNNLYCRHGFKFIPNENKIYRNDPELAGAEIHESYMFINEKNELDFEDTHWSFQFYPPGEELTNDNVDFQGRKYYFINNIEVSEEEYVKSKPKGEMFPLMGRYSFDEIMDYLTSETVPSYSSRTLGDMFEINEY